MKQIKAPFSTRSFGGRNDQFLCFGAVAETKKIGTNDGEVMECKWFGLTKLRSDMKKARKHIINEGHHVKSRVSLPVSGKYETFGWQDLKWACSYYGDGLKVDLMSTGVWVYTTD